MMAKGLLMNFIIGLPLFLTRAKMKDSSSLIVSGSLTLVISTREYFFSLFSTASGKTCQMRSSILSNKNHIANNLVETHWLSIRRMSLAAHYCKQKISQVYSAALIAGLVVVMHVTKREMSFVDKSPILGVFLCTRATRLESRTLGRAGLSNC